jgi:hypothetical protein
MAKLYNNDKNFLIIEINREEATSLGFGLHTEKTLNECICGGCNNIIDDMMYYIAAINEVMCKDCCDDYIKTMNHYGDKDSIEYEVNHFNYFSGKLNMSETATISGKNKIVISSK